MSNISFYPIPANQYDSLAYFYANPSLVLGSMSKNGGDQTLVSIEYDNVSSSLLYVYSLQVSIGSAPPLLITSAGILSDGYTLQFVISEGVTGVSYDLKITVTFSNGVSRTDTLEVDVPSVYPPQLQPLANVITEANPLTGSGAIFINSGIRLFVNNEQPSGPNILDQWYNLTDGGLYEYVSNGFSTSWMQIGNVTPALPPVNLEQLTVTTINVVPVLANNVTPGGVIILVINGNVFLPIGSSPPFSVLNNQITWLSTIYTLVPGTLIDVVYQYGSGSGNISETPSVGGLQLTMQQLTITTNNEFPPLSFPFTINGIFILIVNGTSFTPVEAPPPFSVDGTEITWLSTTLAVPPGSDVVAIYQYGT